MCTQHSITKLKYILNIRKKALKFVNLLWIKKINVHKADEVFNGNFFYSKRFERILKMSDN